MKSTSRHKLIQLIKIAAIVIGWCIAALLVALSAEKDEKKWRSLAVVTVLAFGGLSQAIVSYRRGSKAPDQQCPPAPRAKPNAPAANSASLIPPPLPTTAMSPTQTHQHPSAVPPPLPSVPPSLPAPEQPPPIPPAETPPTDDFSIPHEGWAKASLVLGLISLFAWTIPFLGFVTAIPGLFLGVMSSPPTQALRRIGILCACIGLIASAITQYRTPTRTSTIAFPGSSQFPSKAEIQRHLAEVKKSAQTSGLTLKQTQLASTTLSGTWTVRNKWIDDTPKNWSGSTVVIGRLAGENPACIYLATNSHCLDLDSAYTASQGMLAQGLSHYALTVTFPTGKIAYVSRIADTRNQGMDLALLEIPVAGLVEGLDFVPLRIPQSVTVEPGDKVLAVGTPLGLTGTVTTGVVSALRPQTYSDGSPSWTWIQHTAPINSGNSGGPLFVERDGGYEWIGINTLSVTEAQGLFFSLRAETVGAKTTKYSEWVPCDASGAATQIRLRGGAVNVVK